MKYLFLVKHSIPWYLFTMTSNFIMVTHAQGQNYVDLVKLNYNFSAPSAFKNSSVNSTIIELDIDATIPIVITDNTTLITGLSAEAFRVKLDTNNLTKDIYSVNLKLGTNFTHGDKWSGTYVLLPKISSDFETITKKDFQIGGLALLKYKCNPNLNYRVGMYLNTEFFGLWLVPLAGVYYLSNSKKFEMNLTLPFLADINYRFNASLATGISFNGLTKSYRITTSDDKHGYLARATNELYTYLSFNLTNKILLQTKVGHSFGRYYKLYEEGDQVSLGVPLVYFGDRRNQLNTDISDGWVVQIMVLYRLAIEP